MDDIVSPYGMQGIIAVVEIAPHVIPAEQIVQLLSVELLLQLVLLSTENHKFTSVTHVHRSCLLWDLEASGAGFLLK